MEGTQIEWADHTFNPWWGCEKVSAGCAHCYAEALSKRWGKDIWGAGKPRQVTSAANWREPMKWQRRLEDDTKWKAKIAAGIYGKGVSVPKGCELPRERVFCGSMCDVFENPWGMEFLDMREEIDGLDHTWPNRLPSDYFPLEFVGWKLTELIERTPALDWLLLTKRPQNIPEGLGERYGNVWLGVSVEDQVTADERIPELLRYGAAVRFVSYEPALGPVDFSKWVKNEERSSGIDWIIIGGESGPGAREFRACWALDAIRQCTETARSRRGEVKHGYDFLIGERTKVFVKQLGARPMACATLIEEGVPLMTHAGCSGAGAVRWKLKHPKGGDPEEWAPMLRLREIPVPTWGRRG